ncbi:MAG: 3-deoxy-manno-octulosonate cytidylyltransferase [Alphaproteobacteria bacterium]
MKTAIIIPARYGSTRFPGKPLAQIGGQSMISRVVDLARKASEKFVGIQICIATDDERIAGHAREIGTDCIMTDASCRTGSDRVMAAALQMRDKPDFVLNLQGDAPFTPPQAIHAMLDYMHNTPDCEVVTPVHQLSWVDLTRLRTAKDVTPFSGTTVAYGKDGKAFWFSKNIIPAIRNEPKMRDENEHSPVYQHMGLYGYRMDILEKFCSLPEGYYERLEGLEQLRMLENGISIHCVEIALDEGQMQSGIDTPEDLKRAEDYLNR